MQGDFSRDSFDPLQRFSRVLEQQGRVLLDADRNELQSIQLHLMRGLAKDLIGPHGGLHAADTPDGPGINSFKIDTSADLRNSFLVMPGHYYVDGWLCQSDAAVRYAGEEPDSPAQPFFRADALKLGRYLVYLDVWERHLSASEAPGLHEVALGAADAASRAQLVWQVKVAEVGTLMPKPTESTEPKLREFVDKSWSKWSAAWQPDSRGRLSAKAGAPSTGSALAACAVAPEARYRGVENQLYRIEIHRGGTAAGGASFKWSRENASVVFPVATPVDGKIVKLSSWWRDDRLGLARGDWVEVLDDDTSLGQAAKPLRSVEKGPDRDSMSIQLDAKPDIKGDDAAKHPILRRWDHGSKSIELGAVKLDDQNAITIVEGRDLQIEDGITVCFSPAGSGAAHQYRTGDYWLIPARTATGGILWPQQSDGSTRMPRSLPPHGVEHHYAPLAIVDVLDTGEVKRLADLRRTFAPLANY